MTFIILYIFIVNKKIMRRKLNSDEKKVRLTITINPILAKKLLEQHSNVSKHIEWLVYQNMLKDNTITEMPL